MTNRSLPAPLRRRLVALVTLLCLAAPAAAARALTPERSAAGSGGTAAFDDDLREADCTLLGREFVKQRGCSRTKCFEGAVPSLHSR